VQRAQEAWARHLGRKAEETVEVAGGVAMTFALVPPGKFLMGSPPSEIDGLLRQSPDAKREWYHDESLHVVTLTDPFYLGKTEVTQAQFRDLTGKDPSQFKGADNPVEEVSWDEARDYAARLTNRRGGHLVYRLPTEAEWEYACRGGRSCSRPFGIADGGALSSLEANFDGNYQYGGAAEGPYLQATSRAGSYRPNALGLFDMHGNVWEWCADWYGPYPQGEITNPTGPAEGSLRVMRGGSWFSHSRDCRAANRGRMEPGSRNYKLGFRLARSIPSGGK
jgi:formylglycine-generating enzyme required for sulfatase activity